MTLVRVPVYGYLFGHAARCTLHDSRKLLVNVKHESDNKGGPRRVGLFVTCMVETLYPDVGMAAVGLLERSGVEVLFPEEQTCCGQPAFNSGYRREALEMARHFVHVFGAPLERGEIEAIVAPSGSCVAMVREYYEVLFESVAEEAERRRAATVSAATYELTEYLVDVLHVDRVASDFGGKLTYHPCCHLLRGLGVDEQPRSLLSQLQNVEYVDLEADHECCGFGGVFAVKNEAISAAMGRRKTTHLEATGAEYVAVSDVSCLTHLNGLLDREGKRCRAVHIAEVLNGSRAADR